MCRGAKKQPAAPRAQKKPTDGELKEQCKQEYDALKRQVMQFLISAAVDPAGGRGARHQVTDAEVQKPFEDQKKQSFPKEADYKKFLKTSGQTEAGHALPREARRALEQGRAKRSSRARARSPTTTSRTTTTRTRSASPSPSAATSTSCSPRPRRRPTRPSRRSVGRELQGRGEEVLDRRGLEGQGGKLPGVAKGQQEKAFDDADLRGRRRARSTGPVKTQFGYYVFKVTRSRGLAAVTRRRPRRRSEPAQVAERAEGARRLRQEVPEKYKDETNCAEGLRRRRVQERAEAEDRHRRPRRRAPAAPPQRSATGRAARRRAAGRRPAAARRRPGRAAAGASRAPYPAVARVPDSAAGALARLDEITRRLRRECPWDREQDERSIVPHTVEEAYELADAAHAGDDAKLLDELGDVLFQVYFLSLLLEERGAGRPRRGGRPLPREADPPPPARVRRRGGRHRRRACSRNWDEIKRDERARRAIFGELPETCPRRSTPQAAAPRRRTEREDADGALRDRARPPARELVRGDRRAALAAVALRASAGVDPELALRAAADRFKRATEEAQ